MIDPESLRDAEQRRLIGYIGSGPPEPPQIDPPLRVESRKANTSASGRAKAGFMIDLLVG